MILNDKILIMSLIHDDIVNSKLVDGLNELGLYSGDYYLRLSQTIFRLMGIPDRPDTEPVYERYRALLYRARHIDVADGATQLEHLVQEIYGMLCTYV